MSTATRNKQMEFYSDAVAVNTQGRIVLGTRPSAHLFELGVQWEHPVNGTQQMHLEVFANTRAQAASMAKRNGYTVRDVNMVG